MQTKMNKVLAGDASVGAAAVLVAWAVEQWAPFDVGVIEAGAFVVLAQSLAHKLMDRFTSDD